MRIYGSFLDKEGTLECALVGIGRVFIPGMQLGEWSIAGA
jgi:hypothetical protein